MLIFHFLWGILLFSSIKASAPICATDEELAELQGALQADEPCRSYDKRIGFLLLSMKSNLFFVTYAKLGTTFRSFNGIMRIEHAKFIGQCIDFHHCEGMSEVVDFLFLQSEFARFVQDDGLFKNTFPQLFLSSYTQTCKDIFERRAENFPIVNELMERLQGMDVTMFPDFATRLVDTFLRLYYGEENKKLSKDFPVPAIGAVINQCGISLEIFQQWVPYIPPTCVVQAVLASQRHDLIGQFIQKTDYPIDIKPIVHFMNPGISIALNFKRFAEVAKTFLSEAKNCYLMIKRCETIDSDKSWSMSYALISAMPSLVLHDDIEYIHDENIFDTCKVVRFYQEISRNGLKHAVKPSKFLSLEFKEAKGSSVALSYLLYQNHREKYIVRFALAHFGALEIDQMKEIVILALEEGEVLIALGALMSIYRITNGFDDVFDPIDWIISGNELNGMLVKLEDDTDFEKVLLRGLKLSAQTGDRYLAIAILWHFDVNLGDVFFSNPSLLPFSEFFFSILPKNHSFLLRRFCSSSSALQFLLVVMQSWPETKQKLARYILAHSGTMNPQQLLTACWCLIQ